MGLACDIQAVLCSIAQLPCGQEFCIKLVKQLSVSKYCLGSLRKVPLPCSCVQGSPLPLSLTLWPAVAQKS